MSPSPKFSEELLLPADRYILFEQKRERNLYKSNFGFAACFKHFADLF